ncbi:TetR/AcrR family transcriptional regulator [Bailinhaonella thermotolerans]|uniref:TetR/AcrR family transcriptional regulator n=1 Tax=Bailinhaonella thermotolerans TaxID=1070861 RepID=A0A3A4ASX6_9ACTN|nr:TetR/AcrR family transcriptional regulator [Bailinhaonella thermotolerans]RJL24458.1 TetR/AcrR family transcriptional regulator [Bailinhaonella thermotolerans]
MDRRAELAEQVLDYVLEHGLIGLSLRPLAAALHTSDRMLLYHFGSKERLVGEALALAQRRLAASVAPPGPDVRTVGQLVRHLWAELQSPPGIQATRLYLDLSVLATKEPARWSGAVERLRGPWRGPLRDGLVLFGVPAAEAPALADLILGTLDGLSLDRLVAEDSARADAALTAFADLLDARPLPAGDHGGDHRENPART